MNVVVTGYPAGKTIHAIKAIRSATGLGLKEAKDVADSVDMGREPQITLSEPSRSADLDEYGITWHRAPVTIGVGDFVEVLTRYPHDMTVGGLLDVLIAVRDTEWT